VYGSTEIHEYEPKHFIRDNSPLQFAEVPQLEMISDLRDDVLVVKLHTRSMLHLLETLATLHIVQAGKTILPS